MRSLSLSSATNTFGQQIIILSFLETIRMQTMCVLYLEICTGYWLTDVINRFSDLFGISKRKTCRISFYLAHFRSTQGVIEIQNQNIDSLCQRSVKWFPFLTLYLDRNEPKDITTTNWQRKSEQVYGWHFGHSMKFNIELCTHKVPSVQFFFSISQTKVRFQFIAWHTKHWLYSKAAYGLKRRIYLK